MSEKSEKDEKCGLCLIYHHYISKMKADILCTCGRKISISKAGEPKRPLLLMEYKCLVEQAEEKNEGDEKEADESMPELTDPEYQKETEETMTEDTEEDDRISVTINEDFFSEPESSKKSTRTRKTSSDMDLGESTDEEKEDSEKMPELHFEQDAPEPVPPPATRERPERKKTFSSEPPPMDEVPMNSDEPTSDFINETVAPPPFDEEDNGDGISFSQADLQAISRSRLLSPIQNRTADHGSDSSLSASTDDEADLPARIAHRDHLAFIKQEPNYDV